MTIIMKIITNITSIVIIIIIGGGAGRTRNLLVGISGRVSPLCGNQEVPPPLKVKNLLGATFLLSFRLTICSKCRCDILDVKMGSKQYPYLFHDMVAVSGRCGKAESYFCCGFPCFCTFYHNFSRISLEFIGVSPDCRRSFTGLSPQFRQNFELEHHEKEACYNSGFPHWETPYNIT